MKGPKNAYAICGARRHNCSVAAASNVVISKQPHQHNNSKSTAAATATNRRRHPEESKTAIRWRRVWRKAGAAFGAAANATGGSTTVVHRPATCITPAVRIVRHRPSTKKPKKSREGRTSKS